MTLSPKFKIIKFHSTCLDLYLAKYDGLLLLGLHLLIGSHLLLVGIRGLLAFSLYHIGDSG